MKVRKKISDVSPWIPCASPVSSVVPASATPLFASSVALEVSSAPASLTHPSTRSTPSDTPASISDDCSAIPLKTSRKMTTPSAINARSTRMAPPIRGIPCCCSFVTTGPATVARTAPIITGSAIVDVSPSSQMAPKRTRPTPTKNQASSPRSRSHMGAEKTRDSEVASILTTVSSDAGRSRFCGCSDLRDGSDRRALPSSPRALCPQRRTRPASMPTGSPHGRGRSEAVPSPG